MLGLLKLNNLLSSDLSWNLDIFLIRNLYSFFDDSLDFFFYNSFYIDRFLDDSINLDNLVYIFDWGDFDYFFDLDYSRNNSAFSYSFFDNFFYRNNKFFFYNNISISLNWYLDILSNYLVYGNLYFSDDFYWFFDDLLYFNILVFINIDNSIYIDIFWHFYNSINISWNLDFSIDRSLNNPINILRNIDLYILNSLNRNFLDSFNLDKFLNILRYCYRFLNLFNLRNFNYSLIRNFDSSLYKSIYCDFDIIDSINNSLNENIIRNIDDSINNSLYSFLYVNIFLNRNFLLDLSSSDLSSSWLNNSPFDLFVNHDRNINSLLYLIVDFLIDYILNMSLDNILNNDWLFNDLLNFSFDDIFHWSLYDSLNWIIYKSLINDIFLDVSLDWFFYQNLIWSFHYDFFNHRSFYQNIILFLDYVLVDDWIDLMDLNWVFDWLLTEFINRRSIEILIRFLSTSFNVVIRRSGYLRHLAVSLVIQLVLFSHHLRKEPQNLISLSRPLSWNLGLDLLIRGLSLLEDSLLVNISHSFGKNFSNLIALFLQ